jgi:hypothetical protein
MSKFTRLLQPLRRAAQAFFQSDVTLQRDPSGVRLTLQERVSEAIVRPRTEADVVAERRQQELRLMISQLSEVLDEMPETRDTLRHLVFVEQALAKKGLKSLKKMPLEVLRRALEQFEGLVINWSPEGLANLRSKMAVAVIDRETFPGMTDPDGMDSMFDPERVEAVIDTPRAHAERAIATARHGSFEDSTIERMALQFGLAGADPFSASPEVEMQGELDSPSGRALARAPGHKGAGAAGNPMIRLRDVQG